MATLGYSTQGSNTIGYTSTYYLASHDTSDGSGGNTDHIHIRVRNTGAADAHLKVAIYSDDAGNNRPQTRMAAEVEATVPTNGGLAQTIDIDYVVTLAASTKYWLVWIGDINSLEVYYNWESANRGSYDTAASYSLPATWSDVSSEWSMQMSIWADYVAAAGGGSVVTAYQVYYDRMRRVQ
jgi:hypothetical protein